MLLFLTAHPLWPSVSHVSHQEPQQLGVVLVAMTNAVLVTFPLVFLHNLKHKIWATWWEFNICENISKSNKKDHINTSFRPLRAVGVSAVGAHSLMSWSKPLVAIPGRCGCGSKQFTCGCREIRKRQRDNFLSNTANVSQAAKRNYKLFFVVMTITSKITAYNDTG